MEYSFCSFRGIKTMRYPITIFFQPTRKSPAVCVTRVQRRCAFSRCVPEQYTCMQRKLLNLNPFFLGVKCVLCDEQRRATSEVLQFEVRYSERVRTTATHRYPTHYYVTSPPSHTSVHLKSLISTPFALKGSLASDNTQLTRDYHLAF